MNEPEEKIDYLSELYNLYKNELEPNYYSLNVIFSLIGALFITGLFMSDPDDIYDQYYILYLIGMVILYVLIIFNTFKIAKPLDQFMSIPLTRIIIGFILSLIFAFSSAQTSIALNSIFSVPASTFKTSMLFGTFLYFLTHLILILKFYVSIAFGITLLIYFSESYKSVDKGIEYLTGLLKLDNWTFNIDLSLGKAVVAFIFLLGIFHLDNVVLKVDSIKQKLYVLAINYDFDSENSCKNINGDYPVAYVGSNMDKVIVNRYEGEYNVRIDKLERFLRDPNYKSFNNDLGIVQAYFERDKCIF